MPSMVSIPTARTGVHSALGCFLRLQSLWWCATNIPISPLVLSLRSAPDMNLAGLVRDGNTAEDCGLLSNFDPHHYLPTQSNVKPWKWILQSEEHKHLDLCLTYSCTSGSSQRHDIVHAVEPDFSLFELISQFLIRGQFGVICVYNKRGIWANNGRKMVYYKLWNATQHALVCV